MTKRARLTRPVMMHLEGQPVVLPELVPAGTLVYVGRERRNGTLPIRVCGTLLVQDVYSSTLEDVA